jgi:hypothetical protein
MGGEEWGVGVGWGYVFGDGQQGRQVGGRHAIDEEEQQTGQRIEVLRLVEHLEHVLQVDVRTHPRRVTSGAPARATTTAIIIAAIAVSKPTRKQGQPPGRVGG